jgi:N-acetylglucosaminyldiphosphoundecaprenol N-acetyl-beta-D-mannosaminyltransferase
MPTVCETVDLTSFSLLGIRVDTLDRSGIVRAVADSIASGKRSVIANHNMHSLFMYYHDAKVREFFSVAEYIHIDGMSLVMIGRMMGMPLKREHRTTYLDLLPAVASEAAKCGWRIFFLGSKPNVGARAAVALRNEYPGLQIRTHHGHFNPDRWGKENQSVLAEINAYAPHILVVGMGMPRQELWILENRQTLQANVILPGGAIMDYIAGAVPTPPRWLGPLGLEWFYRLLTEPARLSRRYLLEPWFVLGKIAGQYLRGGQQVAAAGIPRRELKP